MKTFTSNFPYECTAFIKSHYLLHLVVHLQHLGDHSNLAGSAIVSVFLDIFNSFTLSPKCFDTVLWVAKQEHISSIHLILPDQVTIHKRRWRDSYPVYVIIFVASAMKKFPPTTWTGHYVHFPFVSKNINPDHDWHLCQRLAYGKGKTKQNRTVRSPSLFPVSWLHACHNFHQGNSSSKVLFSS